jgi:plasmid maintenance system antidote protein VapI
MAIRFEKAFGINADTLMRMQTAFDMAQARARADDHPHPEALRGSNRNEAHD